MRRTGGRAEALSGPAAIIDRRPDAGAEML